MLLTEMINKCQENLYIFDILFYKLLYFKLLQRYWVNKKVQW